MILLFHSRCLNVADFCGVATFDSYYYNLLTIVRCVIHMDLQLTWVFPVHLEEDLLERTSVLKGSHLVVTGPAHLG